MRWAKILLIGCALNLGGSSLAATAPEAHRYTTSNGWKLVAGLTANKSRVVLGEPVWLTFEAKNENAIDLHLRTSLVTTAGGRTADFSLVVTHVRTGKRLALPNTGPSVGSILQTKRIPAGKSYVRHLFLPLWATLDKPGRYVVSCSKPLVLQSKADPGARTFDANTVSRVEIEVLPPDASAMGAVIDALGRRMLGPADPWKRAVKSLQRIRDARVIDWWKRAIDTGRRELMYEAPRGLTLFSERAAVDQLKRLSKTAAKDILNPLDAKHAPRVATAIRSATAGWLPRSPNPAARDVLRAMHTDPDAGVRLSVVWGLEETLDAKARTTLEKMSKDPAERVRTEAKRVLSRQR